MLGKGITPSLSNRLIYSYLPNVFVIQNFSKTIADLICITQTFNEPRKVNAVLFLGEILIKIKHSVLDKGPGLVERQWLVNGHHINNFLNCF